MAGKCHQGIDRYFNASVAYSKEEFYRKASEPSFLDFKPVSRNVAVVIGDGRAILCKLPIYISAAVYSGAKLFLWRSYFFVASQLFLNGGYNTRALGTDTDSLVISLSRRRNALDREEVKRVRRACAQGGNALLYRDSNIAHDHHCNYLRALINILDLSSLTTNSLLTTLVSQQSVVCKNAFKYLSLIRKNASLYYKDETSRDVQSWWGFVPKTISA